jgi:hypothetical protein
LINRNVSIKNGDINILVNISSSLSVNLFKNYYLVSSFTTYPIQPVRDEVLKSSVKPPTITSKYDSNAMSTVVEWHVSLF